MPLPLEIDEQIRKRFDDLIVEAGDLANKIQMVNQENARSAEAWENDRYARGSGAVRRTLSQGESLFFSLRTRILSLLEMISLADSHIARLITHIEAMHSIHQVGQLHGILVGLKDDYDAGMLERISTLIEANIASDYMGQAEHLITEGITGQYEHVPAAVLAGAVFEDRLRSLCQRQNPPIELVDSHGNKKTLDPLITDLQKAKVFNKAKGDLLKSWAKIRNYAAHGEFTEFNRADVEAMIAGIKNFVSDYI